MAPQEAISRFHGIQRIISGGQTGVDRAALDFAMQMGIDHGGWCPLGRRAEDGCIPERYRLQETTSANYAVRTEKNVAEADATLLLYREKLQRGTLLTKQIANHLKKPCLTVRLDRPADIDRIVHWIHNQSIRVLNIAGPRASNHPAIYLQAQELLHHLFGSTPTFPDLLPISPPPQKPT